MLSACNIRGISMLKIVVDAVVASWKQEQLVRGSSGQVHDDAVAMNRSCKSRHYPTTSDSGVIRLD